MNRSNQLSGTEATTRTNGSGAAAVLAAATGSFALGILSLAADKSALVKSRMVFYKPTGPLSGVTTVAILIWLVSWGLLEMRWSRSSVALRPICVASFFLLALGFLLTFPPFVDIF